MCIWNVARTEEEIKMDMDGETIQAVLPADKLTTTWGRLKMEH